MGLMRRWPRRVVKGLGNVIDVYQCPLCGRTKAVNADAKTFRSPPPLECHDCGAHDMTTYRYYARSPLPAIRAVLSAYRSTDAHITEAQIEAAWAEFDGMGGASR